MLTNREQFLKKMGLPLTTSLSTAEMSRLSEVPVKALDEVEAKGKGAYASNMRSVRLLGSFKKNANPAIGYNQRLSIEQWYKARQYAFLNKSPKVYYGADNAIRLKYGLK